MDTIKNLDVLRRTVTGSLHSLVSSLDGPRVLIDNDGAEHIVPSCARMLLVWDDNCQTDWIDRRMDQAELLLHAAHSAQFTGARIVTAYDVRTAGRNYVVGGAEDMPF